MTGLINTLVLAALALGGLDLQGCVTDVLDGLLPAVAL